MILTASSTPRRERREVPWELIFSPHVPHGATPNSIPGKTAESRPVTAPTPASTPPVGHEVCTTALTELLSLASCELTSGAEGGMTSPPIPVTTDMTCACAWGTVLSRPHQPPSIRTTGSRCVVSRLQGRSQYEVPRRPPTIRLQPSGQQRSVDNYSMLRGSVWTT
jgi:hypothetical protein